ncbi:MAG: hypothetical protein A3B86_04690 [Candidatus Yanofskybacteria bacterium RIFCSPHIGHO2_02_FULL_38_22b]|uniref:Response regulatory domain-containing protein n=1 Tax=Candidatus Yanofskybacteria bacterium RIFCSPHIGHO2_02_FULL_38_22b TaxID=1802673 RepID=A0A1F8F4H3_9BACT|nr:MAG: hypothetical protein A2816_01165 [Candidatus Yanofskybacteria bacterium RIFCSPHIGHO2_01_FULL_39_44]OGN07510.1 MAG: hypothetical protein A3B86_04690 [Candidatus Yanofskybacteria bacterium RIFCSPHIGHO2_02_FULL_38_22b]
MTDEQNINISPMGRSYKTVLIIEDEDAIRWALRDNLPQMGVNVLEAENGQKGLDLALSEHPDLIILDLILPKVYGIDVLKKLRDDEWGKNAKVVVITSMDNDEIAEEAKGFGVKEFLIKKDWQLDEVLKFIKSKLEI